MPAVVLVMGIIYPAIALVAWILVGASIVAAYRLDVRKSYYGGWTENKKMGMFFLWFFSGPLWPLIVPGILTFKLAGRLEARAIGKA